MYIYSFVSIMVPIFISVQAHSSVERAGLLGGVQFRLLETDTKHQLRGETLATAIRDDKEKGLIPFYVKFSTFIYHLFNIFKYYSYKLYFRLLLHWGLPHLVHLIVWMK
jgi:hypothetical protein